MLMDQRGNLRGPRRWPSFRFISGIAAFGLGLVLLGTAAAYFGYTYFAGRNLDDLVASAPDPTETLSSAGATQSPIGGRVVPAEQWLYPGSLLAARLWADTRGSLDLDLPELQGFAAVSGTNAPSIGGSIGRAERITIPALGIDAGVDELALVNLGESASYETPAFIVGHIPETPNPGSHGNGWYFGHLESPAQGEGNVFSQLPRIPDLLRDGEDVQILIRTGDREYLYQVSKTDLVRQEDIRIYQADDARITLVTCFPRLKYDHRLLVTAKLIGFRDGTGSPG